MRAEEQIALVVAADDRGDVALHPREQADDAHRPPADLVDGDQRDAGLGHLAAAIGEARVCAYEQLAKALAEPRRRRGPQARDVVGAAAADLIAPQVDTDGFHRRR